jgi:Fe-S oxidoreductase
VLGERMAEVIPGFDIKVTLLIDMLEAEIHKGGIGFRPLGKRITFQDPCRLGRISGQYDGPRNLLALIPDATRIQRGYRYRDCARPAPRGPTCWSPPARSV